VRITTGLAAAVASVWAAITTVVSAANLPRDASEAWKAVVSAPEYIPYGLAAMLIGALMWSLWWPSRKRESAAPTIPPDPDAMIRHDIERARLEVERADALASLEFRRGLDAYARGESRAPPPLAHIGTLGAAVFGIDEAGSCAVIDIKNFGQGVARNVRWRAVAGWFAGPPQAPVPYEREGNLGITEPGHSQHIKLVLERPLSSAELRRIVPGGQGFYALAEIEYTDSSGAWRTRQIAYYLDPQGERRHDRWMLSVCATGNGELEGRMSDKPHIVHQVTSHGQQGGITAHSVHIAKPPPRTLVEGMKAELLQKLPRDKPVSVEAPVGDQEAIHLASKIRAFLATSGYTFQADFVMAVPFSEPQKGIIIVPNGPGHRVIVGENA